jgi:hypothetical protein
MPFRVLLYSDDAVGRDSLSYFQNRHYQAIRLTDDPKVFWYGVKSVDLGGYLALLSHGNERGPSMIGGTGAPDMDEEEIAALTVRLVQYSITFYCFSCRTGVGPFAQALKDANVTHWVAPVGDAVVANYGNGPGIYSEDQNGQAAGWKGPLAERQTGSGREARGSTSFNVA